MDIDLSILRMLEREKEISFDVLVEAIDLVEQDLTVAIGRHEVVEHQVHRLDLIFVRRR